MSLTQFRSACVACSLALILAAGCGRSTTPDEDQAVAPGGTSKQTGELGEPWKGALPAVSIRGADDAGSQANTGGGFEPGSPQGLLKEIDRLRLRTTPETDDPARLRSHRRWKNERIVERAQEAVALTHTRPEQEDLFNTAVSHLMAARLELALQAGTEQSESETQHVEELYNDAESLYRRDPKSKAAAEAAYVRARFANISADRFAATEPRWMQEFPRQARLFAESFPQEAERAVALLDAAGRSCELHRLREEAVRCYAVLEGTFPQTPQGKQAAAVLRRLRLNGEQLNSFAGPTLDGGYVRIDELRGRVVVVAFWASHSRQCVEQLPRLASLAQRWGDSRATVVAVSLDTDKRAAEKFLAGGKLRTLFWPDAESRGWRNPIVQYYGVRDIPAYWLLDAEGVVVSSLLTLEELEEQVGRLIEQK